MNSHISTTRYIVSSVLLLGLPLAHAGILINFENYNTGNLSGQPGTGTQWAIVNGSTSIVNVADGVGNGGGKGLVNTQLGGSNFVHYGFNTSDSDLGFTFNSASTILNYSFDWRPTQTLDGSDSAYLFDFVLGSSLSTSFSDAANRISIRSDGALRVFDSTNTRLQTGLFFDSVGTYRTISGTLNYETKQFTVFVDGTQLFTDFNGGNLSFHGASDNAYIRVNNLLGNTPANWHEWNLDNISLTQVPEPATASLLLGLLVTAFVVAQRRKVRQG